jgi:hypothetical protein
MFLLNQQPKMLKEMLEYRRADCEGGDHKPANEAV